VEALKHYSCCYCAKEMIHVLIATRVKEKCSSSEKDSVVVVKELLNNQAKWRGEKTLCYKIMCTKLKAMLIFILYRSSYISQLIICHCCMVLSEDKKGQHKISESTLNKVCLPANSCSNSLLQEESIIYSNPNALQSKSFIQMILTSSLQTAPYILHSSG